MVKQCCSTVPNQGTGRTLHGHLGATLSLHMAHMEMVVHGAVWCNASFAINGFLKRFLSVQMNLKTPEFLNVFPWFCLNSDNSAILPTGARLEGSFAVPAC